jgi:hypothetical protein
MLGRVLSSKEAAARIRVNMPLVAANRELITRMEKEIQSTLARVWGENETGNA